VGSQEAQAPRISRQSANGGGKVAALHTSHLYTKEISLVLASVTGWTDSKAIVPPEGLCQSMTPSGIETTTFWFVAHCKYVE